MYISKGFDDYLSKPIDTRRMEKMLLTYIPEKKVTRIKKSDVSDHTKNSLDSKEVKEEYIDKTVGLKYSSQSMDMYKSFLEVYCEYGKDKKLQIEESYAADNWKDYVTYVHSVKSTSLNIGGVRLSKMAADIEKNGKDYLAGDKAGLVFIKEHHNELMQLYDVTLEEAVKLMNAIE